MRRPPAWLSASVAAASMVAIGFAVGVAYKRAQEPEPPANPLASASSEAAVVEACREAIQRVPHETWRASVELSEAVYGGK